MTQWVTPQGRQWSWLLCPERLCLNNSGASKCWWFPGDCWPLSWPFDICTKWLMLWFLLAVCINVLAWLSLSLSLFIDSLVVAKLVNAHLFRWKLIFNMFAFNDNRQFHRYRIWKCEIFNDYVKLPERRTWQDNLEIETILKSHSVIIVSSQ